MYNFIEEKYTQNNSLICNFAQIELAIVVRGVHQTAQTAKTAPKPLTK